MQCSGKLRRYTYIHITTTAEQEQVCTLYTESEETSNEFLMVVGGIHIVELREREREREAERVRDRNKYRHSYSD